MLLDAILGNSLATRGGSYSWSQIPGVLWGGRESSAGATVTEESCLSLSAVFAGVQLLSSMIGTLPLNAYRKLPGGGKDVAKTHRAQRLLHTQPNREMTSKRFRQTLEFHRLLWGNCYAEINWDMGGNPAALWVVEPWRVQQERDEDGRLYHLVDGVRRIEVEDMIHVPLISYDGVVGQAFVNFAIESLGLGLSAQEFAARFFGNGARPGGILEHAGNPKPEARKEMRDGWQAQHGGSKNSSRVAVLWGGWTFKSEGGSIPPEQSQLLETRRFQTEEVARWLNLPPHVLRDLSRSTNNNIEHQGLELVTYTIMPIAVDYEQEYDRKLLNPPDLYSKHSLEGLLRGDMAARSAWYREMANIGVYSVNMILGYEDEAPIEGGDVHLVQGAMVPIKGIEERAAKASEPKPAPTPEQPHTEEPPTEPKPALQPDVTLAKIELLGDTLRRLQTKELNAAIRAANKPGDFLKWMDEFYPKHEATLSEALATVLPLTSPDCTGLPTAWCETSRGRWLELTGETLAGSLQDAVEREAQIWAGRPAKMAKRVVLEQTDEVSLCGL